MTRVERHDVPQTCVIACPRLLSLRAQDLCHCERSAAISCLVVWPLAEEIATSLRSSR